MLDSWLLQLRLFPRQFWQALQSLAQHCLTGLVGLVMPLVLFVGFSHEFGNPDLGRSAAPPAPAAALGLEAWRNLLHLRVEPKPTAMFAREQCDRRGAMQEWRAGQILDWLPTAADPVMAVEPSWVLLFELPQGNVAAATLRPLSKALFRPLFGPLFQVQPQDWIYQTLLPWRDPLPPNPIHQPF